MATTNERQSEAELFMGYGEPQPDGGHWGKFFTSRHEGPWLQCPICNPGRARRAALLHPLMLGDGLTELPTGTIGRVIMILNSDVRIVFSVDGEDVTLLVDRSSLDIEE